MAVAMLFLIVDKIRHEELLETSLFFGELGLDGSVRRVNGILPAVVAAMKQGYTRFFIPKDNVYELEYIQDIIIYPLSSFSQILDMFVRGNECPRAESGKDISSMLRQTNQYSVDFADIK